MDETMAVVDEPGTRVPRLYRRWECVNRIIENNRGKNEMIVAAGMAVYDSTRDNSFRRVFARADFMMYQRKDELKHLKGKAY